MPSGVGDEIRKIACFAALSTFSLSGIHIYLGIQTNVTGVGTNNYIDEGLNVHDEGLSRNGIEYDGDDEEGT